MTRKQAWVWLAAALVLSNAHLALAAEQMFRYPFREPDHPIDPTKGATLFNGHYMANLFEGLAEPGPGGRIAMLGATEYKMGNDGRSYTFLLRRGVKWSDGTPVTAHDYEFAWKRALDPKTGNINLSNLLSLKNARAFNKGELKDSGEVGVQAKDDSTLEVTLEGPRGWFLSSIAADTAWLPVPRHVIAKFGDTWTEPDHIATNGPFVIESWRHDQQMVLVANPQYWRDKPVVRVVVTMTNDPQSTSLSAYETDEVDWAWAPLAQLNQLRTHSVLGKELKVATQSATWFTVLDVTTPPLNDVRVRRALYLTVDRPRLTQAFLQGAYAPATSLTPPGMPGHTTNLPLGGGVGEARRLLADAGFPDGRGFPVLTYTTPNLTEDRITAEALQRMWKDALNIEVKIELMERRAFQAWRSARKTQPYHLHYGGWTAEFGDPSVFHNGMLTATIDRQNHKWRDARYEELIAKGASELDPQQRHVLYEQAERIVAEQVPIIPWGYKLKPYLLKPYVKGFEVAPNGWIDLFRKVQIIR